ncbi:MAG: pirin family protein [Labilithrix sp.]|nr:pirin family protein [Labilithrix sp.]
MSANEPIAPVDVRRATERGHADHGWLDSWHTFSFADYYDPKWMGFRALRVINEDRVAPGQGFPKHSHRDMEILSFVLGGGLEHADSIGTGSVIRPGDVQRMSAGTGVTHSEYNASKSERVHFLQVWIQPNQRPIPPSYEQQTFADDDKRGKLRLIASPNGEGGSLTIHADARVFASILDPGARAEHVVVQGRHAWIHVARGKIRVDDHELSAGDAAFTSAGGRIPLEGVEAAEILVFDLA